MTNQPETINPIEGGVQQVYVEIRESIESAMRWEFQRDQGAVDSVLLTLDDAISNNWDNLMAAFWRGVAEDIELIGLAQPVAAPAPLDPHGPTA